MLNPSDPLPRPGSPNSGSSGISNGSGGWSITKARYRFLDASGSPLMDWKTMATTSDPIAPWKTRVDTSGLTGPNPRQFEFEIDGTKDSTTKSSGTQIIECDTDIVMATILVNSVSPDGDTWEWHVYLSDASGFFVDGGRGTA